MIYVIVILAILGLGVYFTRAKVAKTAKEDLAKIKAAIAADAAKIRKKL